MEEMQKIIKQLEAENDILEQHLSEITSDSASAVCGSSSSGQTTPSLSSPAARPCIPAVKPPAEMLGGGNASDSQAQGEVYETQDQATEIPKIEAVGGDHGNNSTIHTTSPVSSTVSTVSMSPTPYHHRDNTSESSSQGFTERSSLLPSHELPSSITTTNNRTAIDC